MANKDKLKRDEAFRLKAEESLKLSLKKSKTKEKKYLTFLLEILSAEKRTGNLIALFNLYKNWDNVKRKKFFSYLETLEKKTDLVNDNFITTLGMLFDKNLFWVKDVSNFEVKTKNANKQLELLINHLFSKYKLPEFTYIMWSRPIEELELCWFLHLAEGKNLKTALNLPFPVTKKMAHYVNTAPSDYNFRQAMVWGLLSTLDCNIYLKKEICSTDVAKQAVNIDFWTTIFSFFKENTYLDLDQVGPLIDYIQFVKYSPHAPNPGFSIRERNPAQLLGQMAQWHEELAQVQRNQRRGRAYKVVNYNWKERYQSWNHIEGQGDNKKNWMITELTSSQELRDEGSSLRHCVASYDERCNRGAVSIFSLCLNRKKTYTIEVSNEQVVQVRGFANARMDKVAQKIIERWADKMNFVIASKA